MMTALTLAIYCDLSNTFLNDVYGFCVYQVGKRPEWYLLNYPVASLTSSFW